ARGPRKLPCGTRYERSTSSPDEFSDPVGVNQPLPCAGSLCASFALTQAAKVRAIGFLGQSFCEAPRTEPVIGPAQGWDPLARRRFAGLGPPLALCKELRMPP